MIVFTRVPTTSLYGRVDQPEGPGWLAFLVTDPPSELPQSIPLEVAWTDAELKGYILFTREEPSNHAAFAEQLQVFRSENPDILPDPEHTSFAWIVVDGSGVVENAFVLPLQPGTETPPQIADPVVFEFANYGIPFQAQSRVQAITNEDLIEAFQVSFPPDLPGADVTGGPAGIFIPLNGDARYALISQALIADFSDSLQTGWDASIRYAYRDPSSPIGMVIQRYPIFEAEPGSDTARQTLFDTQWDPLAPLDPDRTFLEFTGLAYDLTITERGEVAKGSIAPAASVLNTAFRTRFGQPLALRPIVGSAKLVFQPLPTQEGEKFYLTPQGDFAWVNPQADSKRVTEQVLCGLAGAEFLTVTADADGEKSDLLRFQASQKALAPVFPVIGASGAVGLPLLDDGFLTAWVKPVLRGDNPAPVYFAQPRDAGLFAPESSNENGVFDAFNAPAARFAQASSDPFFPMAPYAGVDGGDFPPDDLTQFEDQILNPARRNAIADMDPGPQRLAVAVAESMATTPQGFIATIADLDWKKVLLARDPDDGPDLAFVSLGDRLRQALQSNQLFLVVSDAEPLGQFQNRITLGGWPFTIDPSVNAGSRRDFRNVMIFKFGVGSIRERVRDTSSWTDPSGFNEDPLTVSDWIQRYIAETEQQVSENPRFQKFLDIVDKPAWNGVLMLRVDVGLEDFPKDLKGLLAGIVQEDFFGHHLGIEVNFVEQQNGDQLAVPQSALFGLIAYRDRGFQNRQTSLQVLAQPRTISFLNTQVDAPAAGEGRYDFRVLNLQVVFENSDIVDFESLVTLTTDSWFEEPARVQTGTPLNSILQFAVELSGNYENHNGHRTYTFSTLPDTSYLFVLESATLNAIDIIKAQFSTLDVRDLGTGRERIASRFTFWGFLNFRPLAGFDAYSFGDNRQVSGGRTGLFLSNLNVDMVFDFDVPNRAASNRQFTFTIDKLGLDLGQSDVRVNSLAANFPVTISNLIRGDRGQSPTDIGFVEIQAPPAFDVVGLQDVWFGLVFDLNLGSVGGLAESAGFKASLLVAWSPGSESRSGGVYIKLPLLGGGKKTFSLQNVLKLSIGSIAFETDESVPDQLAYILRFSTIALSFLGISLPPGAETNALLFGNPSAPNSGANLGWYAAFIGPDKRPACVGDI